ncbi:hypothetical protein FQN60_003232 [Etheostoma spectabile]|uniref:Uncharacterized protein n=1 Tax=Etheostoma spectabile TaxID=54343 RepID=A0A5J5CP20_9PERO|nr:hypothetical protein FQN60_003232 [Etheostoma spectabile]
MSDISEVTLNMYLLCMTASCEAISFSFVLKPKWEDMFLFPDFGLFSMLNLLLLDFTETIHMYTADKTSSSVSILI